MKEIIYPELSFQIMGTLFKVQNKLGNTYQEKYYQRALEKEFKNSEISYSREHEVALSYEGESIGRYFLDFVIDGKRHAFGLGAVPERCVIYRDERHVFSHSSLIPWQPA